MDAIARRSFALLVAGACLATPALAERDGRVPARPELAYFEAVNRAGPPSDPELLFLLMAQYLNANEHQAGIAFFSARLQEFEPRLSEAQKSLYLAAIGLLRAGRANDVPLLHRIGWVHQTVDVLEDAKRRSGGEIFIVRWIAGVVYAQLPDFFGRRKAALADLGWCLENSRRAPNPGWLREVYYQLGALSHREGDDAKAQEYLRLSGYPAFDKRVTFTTPFSEDTVTGHKFSAKRITEVVPARVYALSGWEFTEYYFLVSDDGRQLIGIDAGTRPDSARAAYEALRAHAPQVPRLTTVLVTHAHWDHVGGHRYFRALDPRPKFYARSTYRKEVARELAGPRNLTGRFFGSAFDPEDVGSFHPDVLVDRRTELRIGGTRIQAIPIEGGETEDALLYHLPDLGVMFVGDFIMPYLGAPFIEEGNVQGLLDAIDVIVQTNPRVLLHGHEPLTRVFGPPAMLAQLRTDVAWLNEEVLSAVRRGDERAAIQQANLIPPGLLSGDPAAQLPYILLRENVINRIYDQNVGYWQPDLQGVDYLSRADRGSLLVDYLGVSERQLAAATERMVTDGRYELAASALDSARARFPRSERLAGLERLVYLKLMEKYQEFNPFKFIVYSGRAGADVPQMQGSEDR
jgi:glyoxylase-like metal-dependent hydrolase (beta-lactamase superfamily II)